MSNPTANECMNITRLEAGFRYAREHYPELMAQLGDCTNGVDLIQQVIDDVVRLRTIVEARGATIAKLEQEREMLYQKLERAER